MSGSALVLPSTEYVIYPTGTKTFTNDGSPTTTQALFSSVGAGALALAIGAYFFDGMLVMSNMSATSGNIKFDLLGAGTATITPVVQLILGLDATPATIAAGGSYALTTAGQAACVSATTAAALCAVMHGAFRVTVAGTIIPSGSLLTGAAGTVDPGSWFRVKQVGLTGFQTQGPWT